MAIQCRTCGSKSFNPNAKNIFDEEDDEILVNIEVLTGIRIQDDQSMPKHICTCCHLDLYYSIAFRERCLRTENVLQKVVQGATPPSGPIMEAELINNIMRKPEPQSNMTLDMIEELFMQQLAIESQNLRDATIPKVKTQNKTVLSKEIPGNASNSAKVARVSNVKTDTNVAIQSRSSSPSSINDYDNNENVSSEELNKIEAENEANICSERELEKEPSERRSPRRRTQNNNNKLSLKKDSTVPKVDLQQSKIDDMEDKQSKSSEEDNNSSVEDGKSLFSESEDEYLPSPSLLKKITETTNEASKKTPDEPSTKPVRSKWRTVKKKREKITSWSCDICGHKFSTRRIRDLHVMYHNGEKNYKCTECDEQFYTKHRVDLHIRVAHRSEKPFSCRFCDTRFTSVPTRKIHEKNVHYNDFKFECKVCYQMFVTSNCLKTHSIVHTDQRSYNCSLCNKSFKVNDYLQKHYATKYHLRNLLGRKEYNKRAKLQAETCPETGPKKIQLKSSGHTAEEGVPKPIPKPQTNTENKKTTTGLKIYMCDLCGHQSQNSKNLEIHILRHKGEKNFECMECSEKFYNKYLLKLHIRVKHQGEKPFACKFCGILFYSCSARLRHEKVRHIRDFKYECRTCGKKYLTKSCLNKHEFQHTGLKPYRCELCNIGFPRRPGLRVHCRTKQHQMRANEALKNQLNGITIPDEPLEIVNELPLT